MNEEIIAKFGGDTAAIDAAMRKLSHNIKDFAKESQEGVSEVFSKLGIALSLGGVFATFHKVLENVQQIKRASESLAISPEFFQDITNVAKVSGIGGEQVEKMMDHFIKTLPVGSDVEKSFRKLADSISGMEDPSSRARLAVDAFGKSGVKLIPILEQGSAAFDNFANKFVKFGELDIRTIEEANIQLEKTSNWLTVIAGKGLAGASRTLEAMLTSFMTGLSANEVGAMMALEDLDAADESEAKKKRERIASLAAAQNERHDKELASIEKLKGKQFEADLKKMDDEEKLAALQAKFRDERAYGLFGLGGEKKREEALEKALSLEERINEVKERQIKKSEREAEAQAKIAKHLYDQWERSDKSVGDLGKFSVSDLAQMAREQVANNNRSDWVFRKPLADPLRLALTAENELDATRKAELAGDKESADKHRGLYLDAVRANPALSSSEKAIVENADIAKEQLALFKGEGAAVKVKLAD